MLKETRECSTNNNEPIRKKLAKIGEKRSAETNRHLKVMEELNDELLKIQKTCKHDFDNALSGVIFGPVCKICGAIEVRKV